jgi:uncharacterized protein YigA (DUF484 family)
MAERRRRILLEELLEKLCYVQRCAIRSVEIVPIDVEHLFPRHREQATQQALLEAGATRNDVVFRAVHAKVKRLTRFTSKVEILKGG